jgi:acetyl-CoA synthetase
MSHDQDIFPVPPAFAQSALIDKSTYDTMYRRSIDVPTAFWAEQAEALLWHQTWHTVKDSSFAKEDLHIRWFDGGTLNIAENCVDRHLATKANQPAIIWEADDPSTPSRTLTYQQLHTEVCRMANMLQSLGVGQGDRITLYMPMVPEAAIAMLAIARIGAIHSVVFGGFSAHSIRGRIDDCDSRIVITADQGRRGGKVIPMKATVDEAVAGSRVEKVIVLKHTGAEIAWDESRDIWWHDLAATASTSHTAQAFESENPLFILYTSGSTGTPKGLLHTSAGYLLYAMMTFKYVFDYKDGDVFWCTADVGWITGHSYCVYGPLAAGATTLMFEGIPTYPDASRFWQVIDKYKVASFYTAPTAIRMLMREGNEHVTKTSRASLRVLGSVGEPINPEAWRWYHDIVGNGRCQIVDTWWQTETGGHMITPLPGATATKPGSATLPFFGIQPVLLDDAQLEREGLFNDRALCIRRAWPGMARTIWGDHARFYETYFARFPNFYFSGDACRRDKDGYYWIIGRMDDVINVSGHRIGTAEVESALVGIEGVTEAAVVGFPHEIKGEAIYVFVTLKPDVVIDTDEQADALRKKLNAHVRKEIGALASLDKIQFTPAIPKTRSGKIMRRILRKIASGEIQTHKDYEKLGDISTLMDPSVVDHLVAHRLI